MAANPRPTSSPIGVMLDEQPVQENWSLKLSLPQLIATWAAVGVMFILVFIFGLYAGRNQGVELALEEQSTPRLRLPVPDRRVSEAKEQKLEPTPQEDKFDFSNVGEVITPPKAEQGNSPSSFASTPAETLIEAKVAEVPAVPNKLEEKPTPSQTLSERMTLSESIASVEISPVLQKTVEKPAAAPAPVVQKPERTERVVAPAKVEKAKLEKPTPPAASSGKSGYYVQVSAPDSMSQAQLLVSRLKGKGIVAAIRDVEVGGKLRYRVLVGPYSSNETATAAKNQVSRSGVVTGQPFVKKY